MAVVKRVGLQFVSPPKFLGLVVAFLGLIAGTASGFAGSMFYIISYALMSMGTFGMIILLGRYDLEAEKLDDFKGLSIRNSWFAFIMLCLMFSMAGVPPFLGFWSKWFVLKEFFC